MPLRTNPKFERKERHFWVTTPQVRGQVTVNSRGLISNTPPIWRNFLKRPLFSLTSHLKENGLVQVEELK